MELTRLKINGIENPVGYSFDVLDVSWNVENARGKNASMVRVEAAADELFQDILFRTEGDNLSCAGTKLDMCLEPRTRYYVRVAVTDDLGDTASGVTWFETGKLDEVWEADWVGTKQEDTFHPVMRKSFTLASKPDRKSGAEPDSESYLKPAAARLYICGLGAYEAYLNGKKVGEEVLAPFLNDYRFALQAQTYDVTDMLQEENSFEVLLGNGWYKGRFGQEGRSYGDRFALIAELYITYGDGTAETILTDGSWVYRGSDIEDSGIYDGEKLNRCLWKNRENPWKAVEKLPVLDQERMKGLLTDRYSIPVLVKEMIPVKEVMLTPAGETVLDMGQNFTGWLVFKDILSEGTEVHLEFGEVLQNGNFYNDNYRSARGGFKYIAGQNNEGGEWLDKTLVRPHFTFFGFRYVKVSGWNQELNPEDFMGYVVYSDLERTGFLDTSDSKINQLYSNCLWGQKSNFLDMPTDCPQRDERLGWTADAQVFSPTATYNMDTRAFYRKYLWDMRNVQITMDGAVPAYLPASEGMCPVCSVWGDAAAFIPYTIWKFYESPDEMNCLYPLMKEWIDYIAREMQEHCGSDVGIWDFTFHFGDWLALDGPTEQSVKGGTPDGYLATVYYYKSTSIVAEIAGKIGKEKEQKKYLELADRIKERLLFEYFTPAGHLSVNTQTAYIVALRFGIYRDKEVLLQDFLDLLKKHQYRIKCGFAGAPLLCQVLSENGRSDLAYHFLFHEGFPGWLYAVNLGATTIWERWNSLLPDGSISGTGMNSLNHYSYGSVIEFLYAYAAGLRPKEAGFRNVVIMPCPNRRMRSLNCTYLSPAGKYTVNWRLTGEGNVWVHLEVPFGCRAEVTLPESETDAFELEAGIYEYEYKPVHDYRQKYFETSPIKDVFADEEAKTILLKYVPQAAGLDNPVDADEELSVLYDRAFIGINPEDAGKAIQELEDMKLW